MYTFILDIDNLHMNTDYSNIYKQSTENQKGRKVKAMQEAHSNPFRITFAFSPPNCLSKNGLYF